MNNRAKINLKYISFVKQLFSLKVREVDNYLLGRHFFGACQLIEAF